MKPEERARLEIDEKLRASGWIIQDLKDANLAAARGVAIREAQLPRGNVDYGLFVDGKALCSLEAKPEGYTLAGVELQSIKYAAEPGGIATWKEDRLPFTYESTGTETWFTNHLDPEPRSRPVFSKEPPPVEYNSSLPIEAFDVIVTDECHRSIYNLWRQVLEYFDSFLIGLTATPSKQTFGFFHQNLVMEYGHEKAVADGVNVGYDVYRIETAITKQGSKVEAGFYVDKRDRQTRRKRWEQLDDDFAYDAKQLDREVVADDQIRTVLQTFKEKLFTDLFPGRSDVPKTLIFAKDDSHAEDIVRVCREVFDKGNEFCQKITYRTTGVRPEVLLQSFRWRTRPTCRQLT